MKLLVLNFKSRMNMCLLLKLGKCEDKDKKRVRNREGCP